ncbi:MAG: NlpC/P60 family protein [Balneolaceae bacterium]
MQLITLLLLFTSCGVAGRTGVPAAGQEATLSRSSLSASISTEEIQNQLQAAYADWEGTPYQLGGSGPDGVDCSSFMQIVLSDYFDVMLPRNTREQIRVGQGVRRGAIRPGDLIFFRTTRRDLHVGIALSGDDFLHASVSSGVMVSGLDEHYWSSRFLGVRRVL